MALHTRVLKATLAQVVCTQWGKDEMARGSYSSMAVGALGGEDYDLLAESVGERVFFAGEATSRKYPATMHGAFYSGVREVRRPPCVLYLFIFGNVERSQHCFTA